MLQNAQKSYLNTCYCVHITTLYAVSVLRQQPICKQNKTANA